MTKEKIDALKAKIISNGYLTIEDFAHNVLNISRAALYYKLSGKTCWSTDDIKSMKKNLHLSNNEVVSFFLS